MSLDAEAAYRMLVPRGRSITLRRLGNSPPDDVTCVAMVAQMDDLIGAGGVVQFRRRITVSNKEIADAGWPGPPRKGDQIIDAGKTMTVQAVESPGDGTVMHRLETLGS